MFLIIIMILLTMPSPCPMQSNSRICLLCINDDDISGKTTSTTCDDTDLSLDTGATASIMNNKDNNYIGFISLIPVSLFMMMAAAVGGGGALVAT